MCAHGLERWSGAPFEWATLVRLSPLGLLSTTRPIPIRSLTLFSFLFVVFPPALSGTWSDRWVQSSHKKADGTAGELKLVSAFGSSDAAKGVQTSQDARFYAYTSKFTPSFSSVGKDLVLQYSVKHTQKIDCGGGYVKVLPADVDQENFNGDSQYYIMFGPDICGTTTKKVHVIFNYNGQIKKKKQIREAGWNG